MTDSALHPDDVRFWLLLWLIASSGAAVALLTIWAALSRRHWSLRVAAIALPTTLLSLPPAGLLVLSALANTASVLVPIAGWRYWRTPPKITWRFKLADLLLLTAFVASAVWASTLVVDNLRGRFDDYGTMVLVTFLVWGACTGFSSLVAFVSFRSFRRVWAAWLLVIVLSAIAAAAPANLDELWALTFPFSFDFPLWIWYLALPATSMLVAGWLWSWRASGYICCAPELNCADDEKSKTSSVAPRTAQTVLFMLSLAIMALPALAYYQMMTPIPLPVTTLPEPNAYSEFSRIGKELESAKMPDFDTADETELRKVVTDYRQLLDDARVALSHESMIPDDYLKVGYISSSPTIRYLSRLLLAEGRVAVFDGRYDDACDSYLTLARIGGIMGRGGVVIDWLISRVVLREGLTAVPRVAGRLSRGCLDRARTVAATLEGELEPLDEVRTRERVFQERLSATERIRFLRSPIFSNLDQSEHWHRAILRLLAVDLAIRCYQRDRGRFAERLEDLVPEYLPELPLDPFTNRPFIFIPETNKFRLYSTGPDAVDNGGIQKKLNEMPPPGEDLLLMPSEH